MTLTASSASLFNTMREHPRVEMRQIVWQRAARTSAKWFEQHPDWAPTLDAGAGSKEKPHGPPGYKRSQDRPWEAARKDPSDGYWDLWVEDLGQTNDPKTFFGRYR